MTDLPSVAVVLRAGTATAGTVGQIGVTLRTLASIGADAELIVEAACPTRAVVQGAFTELDGPPVRFVEAAPCGTPVAALAVATAAYVTVLHPGDRLLPGATGRAVAALEAQPEAVVHLSRALPQSRAADPGAMHLSDVDLDDPAWARALVAGTAVIEGRTLARSLLSCGQNLIGPPSGVVLRRCALGPADATWATATGAGGTAGRPPAGWLLPLILRLALRGSVVYDPTPGSAVPAPSLETVLSEQDARADLIELAGGLGLLDREEELADAILAHQDAASTLIRRVGALGHCVPADRAAAMATRTAGLWETLRAARLPLEIRVRPGPGDLGVSVRSARMLSDRVSVGDAPAGSLTGSGGAAETPVLLLDAGEEVDVVDRSGLVRDLTAWGGEPVAISTPSGLATRVQRSAAPSEGLTRGDGLASEDPVWRSVRATRNGVVGDWMPRRVRPSLRTSSPERFAIVAPNYSEGSGGIIALHRLCDRLNLLGHTASICPLNPEATVNPHWTTPVLTAPFDLDDSIVVYPEIITGNPLGGRRVVRWLLNRPGYIVGSGPIDAGPDDYLVAFNKCISRDLPFLEAPIIDPTTFYPSSDERRGSLVWFGKAAVPRHLDRSSMTQITRSWPARKSELAARMRAAEVVVSADWMTAINPEALCCGTPVVLVGDGDGRWTRDDLLVVLAGRGIGWEGDDIDRLREEAQGFHAWYLEAIARFDDSVADFVTDAVRHFDARRRAGGRSGPTRPAISDPGSSRLPS